MVTKQLRLTKTESELVEHPELKEWIIQFYDFRTGKRDHLDDRYDSKLQSYPTCFVGDIRKAFGLSNYYSMADLKPPTVSFDICYKCQSYADWFLRFHNEFMGEREMVTQYNKQLQSLVNHIKTFHKNGKKE